MADLPPAEYLAGVLDACAIFRVRETPEGTQLPVVAVHGLPVAVLEVLAAATGTKVTKVTRSYNRAPCGEHCTERHQHVNSVTGRWSITGAKATVVIAAVLPYLRVQRDVAAEVLEVGKLAPRKGSSYGKMADLGWPLPADDEEEQDREQRATQHGDAGGVGQHQGPAGPGGPGLRDARSPGGPQAQDHHLAAERGPRRPALRVLEDRDRGAGDTPDTRPVGELDNRSNSA